MCMTGGCGGGKANNNYTPKSKSAATRSTSGSRPTGAAAWGKPSGNYGKPKVNISFGKKK